MDSLGSDTPGGLAVCPANQLGWSMQTKRLVIRNRPHFPFENPQYAGLFSATLPGRLPQLLANGWVGVAMDTLRTDSHETHHCIIPRVVKAFHS